MQIAVYLKHAGPRQNWGAPQYIRRITTSGRPQIITALEPVEADDSATVEALDVVLSEVVAMTPSLTGYRIEARDFVHVVEG